MASKTVSRGGENVKSYYVNGHQVFSIPADPVGGGESTHEGTYHSHAEAQIAAGAMMWADWLDVWLTGIEDGDLMEAFAQLLRLIPDEEEAHDDEKIEAFYNRVEDRALAILPMGLRLLAERYEREWLSHGITPQGRHLRPI